MARHKAQSAPPPGKRVLIAGAGNIGSSLIPLVGRMGGIGEVTVVDRDVYELRNLPQQNILPPDVGRFKAAVQARRLGRINPSLRVRGIHADLHEVPLGLLRCDVLLACLDSLEARRVVNQAAWRLGLPWIDAGISAQGGLFARVTVYVPGRQSPCIECAWSDVDYDRLEQSHPCQGGGAHAPPTDAPASLGALAASLQAIECRKVLDGDFERALVGRQVLVDALHHRQQVTLFRHNPNCRFDHETWSIRPLDRGAAGTTLRQVLDDAALDLSGAGLGVEGRPFVRAVQCAGCGGTRQVLHLAGRLPKRGTWCSRCGQGMQPVGFEMSDRLGLGGLDRKVLKQPLARLGLRDGDVFSIQFGDRERIQWEVGRDSA